MKANTTLNASIISFTVQITRDSPVDRYIYFGYGGKSQADTASKETSVFL